ncbi:mechanosensitive ion channel family protein [Metallosphaera hakonensis]|uniref:Mechanosensitive ion channel family protein n=1 Tax=Metallosphaera hakonensis JCM 8857 = DSM 7519 TaxID=1293036 RepID=A0A2U9ISH1_9CREN|nr:mechanosensitive ion channel family protein [Metallosphaera hakonensis]AWR98954.1 mechanosensitive ion channel [Metallosphaera hakonensis JCM 8857 = DSM 7519]
MSSTRPLIRVLLLLIIIGAVVYVLHVVLSALIVSNSKILPYVTDIQLGLDAALVGIGGYIIIRIIKYALENYLSTRADKVTIRSVSLIVDLALYTLLVLAILSALGVNLTGAAIGGAVGGVAIGLAAQTVVSNILSGIMVTSSRTVRPGDAIILQSWIWSPPIVGEAERVTLLFTEVRTVTGNLVKVPNSAFLGNTVFTKLREEDKLVYPYQLTVNADVPGNVLMERVRNIIEDEFKGIKAQPPDISFYSKNGSTNVFLVSIKLDEIKNLNHYLSIINQSFEKAYWELKGK